VAPCGRGRARAKVIGQVGPRVGDSAREVRQREGIAGWAGWEEEKWAAVDEYVGRPVSAHRDEGSFSFLVSIFFSLFYFIFKFQIQNSDFNTQYATLQISSINMQVTFICYFLYPFM
jgi:hypothetical protein